MPNYYAQKTLESLRGQPITSPTLLNESNKFYQSYAQSSSMDPISLVAGLGSSLIGGIGSLFSQRSQNKFNAQQAALNRQFIADENAKAFDRNWNQMEYQNQYNSPANQRKLFEQAGVNYQNIVGDQSGTAVSKSGNAASSSGGSPTAPAAPLQMEWVNNLANIGLIQAQTEKTKAEAGAIAHQNNLTDSQSGYYGVLSAGQELQNQITEKYGSLEAFARVNNLEADTAFKDAQRFVARTQEKLNMFDLTNLKPAQQADYLSRVFLSESQDLLNRANAAKSDAERKAILDQLSFNIAYTLSAIRLNNAHASDLRASAAERYAHIGLMGQQKHESWSRTNLNNWDSKLRRIDWQMSNATAFDVVKTFKHQLAVQYKWFDRRLADSWEGTAFTILDETKEIVNLNLGGFVGGTRNLNPTPSHTPIRGFGR